tara:strand:- start:1192 stop:1548 length:357 start_codon:yes stop_codon:yes gene_type:complete
MKVEVYRNLHKNCWSVRSLFTGKVIYHADYIGIKNAKLVVRPGGRAKVLREGRKNVHAFIRGEAVPQWEVVQHCENQISYNPYKNESFILTDTNTPIDHAKTVFLDTTGKGWVDEKYD